MQNFYSRCGHCRAFAPFFRSFAYNIQQWKDVVYVAAINCADEFNQMVCKENEVHGYPMIKVSNFDIFLIISLINNLENFYVIINKLNLNFILLHKIGFIF